MQSTVLAISDRLEDLRRERGLTLEELAEATKISKSALSKYENLDFKDISPFNVATLAKFYGVTTDYLLGVSNIENRSDAEIHELRLTDEALRVLKSGKCNGKLLSDVICHKNFQRLMTDMEIFVDRIASMQIDNLNRFMGSARDTVQAQYHPDENELFFRTFELAQIPADEYVASVLRDDLTGILRDIRETHQEGKKDKSAAPLLSAMEDFQKNVRSVIEAKGSREEQAAKAYLSTFGIDYDSLTPEEFVVLIGILKKSKLARNGISRRGKTQSTLQKKRKK